MNNPFRRKKPKPKRRTPRRVGNGRVRLHGEDMTDLRRQAFERSGGQCEETVTSHALSSPGHYSVINSRCPNRITWDSMELSHERHGPNKSDTLATVKASCKDCHQIGKHNPKPCKRRAGKPMKIKDAQAYWSGKICFCDGPKKEYESFCATCSPKLAEQTRHTLEHTDDPQVYRETLAQAEIEILQWRPKE